jgi:hypothetical protein
MRTALSLVLIILALGACASGGGRVPLDRSVITQEQVQESGASNAFDIVQRYRPEWMRSRGAQSIMNAGAENAVVYVNNNRYGDISTLRQIPADGIGQIRWYSAPEATQRWGTGVSGGVIAVTLR